jgi:hypothetical protein
MANHKVMTGRVSRPEPEEIVADYDEVSGLFLELRAAPAFRDGPANDRDEQAKDLAGDLVEQQILFSQLFDLLTESHVDPLGGLFQFRKHRQELIH